LSTICIRGKLAKLGYMNAKLSKLTNLELSSKAGSRWFGLAM
jgi:hypothetical protein